MTMALSKIYLLQLKLKYIQMVPILHLLFSSLCHLRNKKIEFENNVFYIKTLKLIIINYLAEGVIAFCLNKPHPNPVKL